MGTWTNSNHVIQAVGRYTGISSSSIDLKKTDFVFNDERLAMSTCLAMDHIPDIDQIVRIRQFELDNGKDELEWLWYVYDLIKPSDKDISLCLDGGSYVHALMQRSSAF